MNLLQTTATVIILIIIPIKELYGNQEKSSCGRRLARHETLIRNGLNGLWPWHAALYINRNGNFSYNCGGTIISSRAILTGASCVNEYATRYTSDKISVALGLIDFRISSYYTQRFYVSEVITHPNFNAWEPSNDIAIIRLSSEAMFNDYVQPICLWDLNKVDISEIVGRYGTVVGWGIGENDYKLRQAVVPVVPKSTCVTSDIAYEQLLSDKDLCVGFLNGASVCAGAGGGPIIFEDNDVYSIRGILAQILQTEVYEGNCTTSVYASFTDVAKYLPWIEEVVPELKRTQLNSETCLIPTDLSEARQIYYASQPDHEIPMGSYVDPFVDIIYKCKAKHTIDGGNITNFCLNGNWNVPNHPKCIKICSPMNLFGVTTSVTCEIDGETISCHQSLRPNTIARLTCAIGYRKSTGYFYDVLRCGDDGEWDYQPVRCEPICGIEAPDAVPYIVGGEISNITKVPWHVGIFSDINSKGRFGQICGGTILNAKVVISAAHCFYDSKENRFHNESDFKVAAGKYYRDLYAADPIKSQIVNVANIHHKPEYNDYAGLYAFDIVLLVVEDYIVFKSYIRPICVETLLYNEKNVAPGSIGRVAGWGLESSGGKSSSELKIIDLPAIEYHECKKKFSVEVRPFITPDKFCAGFTDGVGVCQGDSGGGLVFPKMIEGHSVYFLRGIVSTGGNKAGSCDNEKYSIFTNIQYHIEMVTFIESTNRPK